MVDGGQGFPMKHYLNASTVMMAAGLMVVSYWTPVPAQRQTGSPPTGNPAAAGGGVAWAEGTSKLPAPPASQETATVDNSFLPTQEEIKLGREGATEAEKQYKIVKDGPQLQRLRTIGDEIVRAANEPEVIRAYMAEHRPPRARPSAQRVAFQFSFKLAESKEINAFSFSGGPVYVTTGLVN